eukprot:6177043-Pleurochrysis_carterae.AAC.3
MSIARSMLAKLLNKPFPPLARSPQEARARAALACLLRDRGPKHVPKVSPTPESPKTVEGSPARP